MKILIVYGTTEGQTRKIARYMEVILQKAGHVVTLADASDDPPSPEGFDAVLAGASVHISKYQSAIVHYVKKNVQALNVLPTAFFGVCMSVASEDASEHRETEKITVDFLAHTGWRPLMQTHIAGALLYTQYDFFKRWIIKSIAKRKGQNTDTSQDHEYTDWDAVKSFAQEFSMHAKTTQVKGNAALVS